MIKFRVVKFRFAVEKWAMALETIAQEDMPEFARIIGVDESTLRNWRSGDYTRRAFAYPQMTNFINACNWLDLDPREFFELEN